MKSLRIRIEGFTASYPYPFLHSGTMLTLPVPPYSSIFGMMSACAGRDIIPSGFWLGYEFTSLEKRTIDLETTQRLKTDKSGRLYQNPERGISKREFHVFPCMDLYVSEMNLLPIFEFPVTPPHFGRSQDVAWIAKVEEVTIEPVQAGIPEGTLLPYPDLPMGHILPPLVDFYRNDVEGELRVPGRISRYTCLPRNNILQVNASNRLRLFKAAGSQNPFHVVVMTNFE